MMCCELVYLLLCAVLKAGLGVILGTGMIFVLHSIVSIKNSEGFFFKKQGFMQNTIFASHIFYGRHVRVTYKPVGMCII